MAAGRKSTGTAYFLMLFSFVFVCGLQHIYLGNILRAFVWFFTLGLFGIGLIYDLFTMPSQVRKSNSGY
jgi:TM2 domain-containing membrane protein YozV